MSAFKTSALGTLLLSSVLHAKDPAQNPSTEPLFARGEVVREGNTGTRPLLFRVALPPSATNQTITLAYSTQDDNATAGEDYQATQGVVTLSPTATFAEISVLVNGDTIAERFEVFRLVLRDTAAPSSAPPIAVAIGGIEDDDMPSPPDGATFVVRGEGVLEGNTGTRPLRFTVTRTNAQATTPLNLQFNTESETATSGTDFQAASGQITLQSNQASATIAVDVIGDTAVENVELLKLRVSETESTIPAQTAFGAIFDDDATQPPPQGTLAIPLDALVAEPATGETEARLAVRLDRPATEALRFAFTANPNATATAGQDFIGPSNGQLDFAVGDLVKEIPFRILADSLEEGREFVSYTITPPPGVVLQRPLVSLTILDRPQVPPTAVSAFIVPCRPFVREDDPNARLLVKRAGNTSAPLSINFSTQDGTAVAGTDYTSTTGVLNWAAGNSEFKRVDVPIIDDQAVETPERFVVRLTDANGQPFPGRSIAPIVILDSTDQIFVEDFDELCTSGTVFENTGIGE